MLKTVHPEQAGIESACVSRFLTSILGQLFLELSFRDDQAVVTAVKYAENFMNDYNGEAVAARRDL